MTNEIRANIDVRGEQVAAAKLKKVGDAAEKAGDSLEELGGQATDAGKASEKSGDGLKKAGDDAGFLNKQIMELDGNLKKLVVQLDQTGDTSLLKDIRKERRQLNQFKNLAQTLVPDAAGAGESIGKQLVGGIGTAVEAGGPYVSGALAGVAVLAAPGIAATVSAAVLGGVGIGGVIGGVALAAQDQRVKALAGQVGDTFAHEFGEAAAPFVDPLLKSLGKLGTADWAAKLAPSLDKLSTKVDPLTDGVIGLVDKALPGLADAAEAAGPSLDVLADGLPEIGSAVGDFFSTISENDEAAAHALELLIDTTTDFIDLSAFLIDGLSESYEKAYGLAEGLGLISDEMAVAGGRIGESKGELYGFGDAADKAADEVAGLDGALQRLIDDAFGLEEAQDQAADAFARLKEQIAKQREEGDKGAGSLAGQTQAARDNRAALRDLEDIYGRLILENVEAGKSTAGLRAEFEKAAIKAGLSRDAVQRYADVLFKLPREVQIDIWLKTHGQGALNAILNGVNSVQGARASGGPVSAGRNYLVGENGPELLAMGGASGHVYNAGQTASMMSGASGGAVQLDITVRYEGPGGAAGDIGEALAKWLRVDTKVRGGGVVQVAYGEN